MSYIDYVVLALFFGIYIFIGFMAKRKVSSSKDFFIGGGKVPWWLAGISHHVSGYSGVVFVGVTSVRHANATPADHIARHPSKKNLADIVDVTLDCEVEVGDAVIEISGFEQKAAATSTIANAYLLNCMVAETINICVKKGIKPPVWMSGNATGGDEWNNQFIDNFKGRIKAL